MIKKKNRDNNLIYGEITSLGILTLIDDLKKHTNYSSSFLDVGSGYGKLVRMVGEIAKIKSKGIEIDKERYNICNIINYNSKESDIRFKVGDIRDNENLLHEADIIFLHDVAWDSSLTDFVFKNCGKNKIIYLSKIEKSKKKSLEHILLEVSWQPNKIKWYKIITN